MTTAVASPPSFQSLPRIGWNGGSTASGFSAMSTDEVSRMFMPQRKTLQRNNSSSSISSSSSSTSTVTITQSETPASAPLNGDASYVAKKKARGGFWPVSKPDSTSGVTSARANGSVQQSGSAGPNAVAAKNQVQQNGAVQNQTQTNGVRLPSVQPPMETAILALLPMNGTFERKQINVPFFPEVLRVGRQTNAKTVPTPINGFFDSKVLSRQHAEVWAERNGKVWIRDIKSSNGTFVNGQRLSPENRESEPHELRQHDTLELGIDIVSEDQKTIVHHKVSAKVEYVGLPGTSNNVLDMSFGDLDPSHGGSMMGSPMSSPMSHSRSRPGGPAPIGRASASSSVVGGHTGSVAHQRQMNYWGAPLNVEQLVKTLSTEMRAAKQQAADLEQAGTFLTAMLPTDGTQIKAPSPSKEGIQTRHINGRPRPTRVDHVTRFADPPAPPPQQPLPEKPDSAKSSPIDPVSLSNSLKRSDTAKASVNPRNSPTHPQSQIVTLIEALAVAKKELDSQGAKVRELEDMLRQERVAREAAEDRARRIEQTATVRPVTIIEDSTTSTSDQPQRRSAATSLHAQKELPEASEDDLKQELDNVVAEMQRMKTDMARFQRRAESAETDAISAQTSLADMISRLREENGHSVLGMHEKEEHATSSGVPDSSNANNGSSASKSMPRSPHLANGHIRAPIKLPEHLERAVATVLRDGHGSNEMIAQSAPYVSMLGVVLIGVGLMAYLNSWQKAEK